MQRINLTGICLFDADDDYAMSAACPLVARIYYGNGVYDPRHAEDASVMIYRGAALSPQEMPFPAPTPGVGYIVTESVAQSLFFLGRPTYDLYVVNLRQARPQERRKLGMWFSKCPESSPEYHTWMVTDGFRAVVEPYADSPDSYATMENV